VPYQFDTHTRGLPQCTVLYRPRFIKRELGLAREPGVKQKIVFNALLPVTLKQASHWHDMGLYHGTQFGVLAREETVTVCVVMRGDASQVKYI